MRHLVFDVESVGLHGEGFAVGWALIKDGVIVDEWWVGCPIDVAKGTDDDRHWCHKYIPSEVLEPTSPHRREKPSDVRQFFWDIMTKELAMGAMIWADCIWPVEARFLIDCVEDARGRGKKGKSSIGVSSRNNEGPFPLLDIASVRYALAKNPDFSERLKDEMPPHHPLRDAKASARTLVNMFRSGSFIGMGGLVTIEAPEDARTDRGNLAQHSEGQEEQP